MNNHKKSIFVSAFILFLFITPLVYAATSADFQIKAQKYITNNCNKKSPTNEESLLCYLYYKIIEHGTALSSQNSKINSLETKIASLEAKLSELTSPTSDPTPTLTLTPTPMSPSPTLTPTYEGVFSNDVPINVSGYKRLTVVIAGMQGAAGLYYSDDGNSWTLQSKFGEDFGDKSFYMYKVKGKYYKVFSWGGPSTYHYTFDLTSVNSPTADFTVTSLNPGFNTINIFTDTSTGAVSRKWEFGSPYTWTSANSPLNITMDKTGTFIVHLTVQNTDGVVDTKTVYVKVGN